MPIQDKNGNNITAVNAIKSGVTTSISTVIVVKGGVSTTVFSTATPPPATPPPATPPPATPPPATPPPATPPPATPPPATPPPATPPPATPPPSGGCLDINTPIYMYDGTIKILKDIQPGDVLRGYYVPGMIDESIEGWQNWTESLDVKGYEKPTTVVTARFDSYYQYYIINEDIHITNQHPFLANKTNTNLWSWVDAPDLEIGDKIKGRGDSWVEVISVVKVNGLMEVKTLDVEEKDTYFAGNTPIVVHNDLVKA